VRRSLSDPSTLADASVHVLPNIMEGSFVNTSLESLDAVSEAIQVSARVNTKRDIKLRHLLQDLVLLDEVVDKLEAQFEDNFMQGFLLTAAKQLAARSAKGLKRLVNEDSLCWLGGLSIERAERIITLSQYRRVTCAT